ncbi:MAG: putative polysaccharide biosynthesis protein [Tuberibacillus sp.]
MSESRMIRGTLLLTVATFLSKFLGMLFVIPFNAIVGIKGGYLYTFAYTPYAIILSISTVGLPLAVSKFVSKYNTLGDYRTGRKLFRSGLLIMTMTGFIGFLLMYFGAPFLSSLALDGTKSGADYHNLVFIMKVLSYALIIVPAMSLIRGYFQGFESMGPTASSQTIEQIVRIGFGLVGAYIIMEATHSIRNAVAIVTFGAFVGALAGLIDLIRYWFKRKGHLDEMVENSPVDSGVSMKSMYSELIRYAIPFVAVGLANQLYLLIDQFTLNHYLNLYHHHLGLDVESIISNLMMYDQKLVMIPVSLATALAVSVVPAITASFTEGDREETQIRVTKAFQFVIYFTVPAAIGLSMMAYMVYGLLYGFDEGIRVGGYILRWYAPSAVFFAGFSVTAAILQGINSQKVTILSLAVGILLKMCFNPLFLKWWPNVGSILATDLAYMVSIIINLIVIGQMAKYQYRFIAKRFLLISLFTLLMGLSIWILFLIFGGSVPSTRLEALAFSIIGVAVGGFIYLFLSLRSGLAKQVLGSRIPFLSRFM